MRRRIPPTTRAHRLPRRRRALVLAPLLVMALGACQPDDRSVVVGSSSVVSMSAPTTDAVTGATTAASTTATSDLDEADVTTAAVATTAAPITDAPTTSPSTTAALTSTPASAATDAPVVATPTSGSSTVVGPAGSYEVVTVIGRIVDPARDGRVISYKVYAPAGVDAATPVIVVSHGGEGNPRGHLAGEHLGSTFASGGFLAIHLAHDRPAEGSRAIDDRPVDVTFFLDELAAGRIVMPNGFGGTPDLDHVGHTGHSFGAYTSHAVAGATYVRTYRDDRIDAIAPISPQGPDQFGAFVNGPGDSTWSTVTIPSYNLIGGDEIDSNAVDSIDRPGWRLAPFDNYPGTSDTFRTIVAGQNHSDMWRTGADDVQTFIATEILDFMRLYVAGDTTVDPCSIGVGDLVTTTATIERHPADTGTLVSACPT